MVGKNQGMWEVAESTPMQEEYLEKVPTEDMTYDSTGMMLTEQLASKNKNIDLLVKQTLICQNHLIKQQHKKANTDQEDYQQKRKKIASLLYNIMGMFFTVVADAADVIINDVFDALVEDKKDECTLSTMIFISSVQRINLHLPCGMEFVQQSTNKTPLNQQRRPH